MRKLLLLIEWHFAEMYVNFIQQSRKYITYNQAELNLQESA